MGDFCLGVYLQILYTAKNEDRTNTKALFIGEILSLLSNDFDPGSTAMSKLFTGINNPTNLLTKKAAHLTEDDYLRMVDDFRKMVMPMLNQNKISNAVRMMEVAIAEDSDIKQETIVELITGLQKRELEGIVEDPAEFLTGVFLYVMKCTRNPGKSGVVRPIMERLINISPDYAFAGSKNKSSPALEKKKTTSDFKRRESDRHDELIDKKATRFCINYDSQKDWIPLCQVAQITNPTKRHSRKIINDFCKCTRSVQRKILEINEIKKLDFAKSDWWYEYLGIFERDYRKYELGDERYLNAFTQYFPRLLNYGDAMVRTFTKRFFVPKVSAPTMKALSKRHKYNVAELIDEYIYYKDDEDYNKKLEAPMNYMWRELNFSDCPELVLASFLALFIIGTCQVTLHNKKAEKEIVVFSGPGASDVETAEDLFYQTLLTLYEKYEGTK